MVELLDVMTAQEAAQRWHLHDSTLRHAIRDNRLAAHKSKGTWLVTRQAMIALYGEEPKEETEKAD